MADDQDTEISVDRETKLLQCYEAEECIWNVSLRNYRNKLKRQNALERIVSRVGNTG